MNITIELEKLTALRERGDLSQAEFQRAKEILLSQENAAAPSAHEKTSQGKKKRKMQLIVALLLTLTAAMSVASVIINPSPIKLVLVLLWTVASTLAWSAYFSFKTKVESEERSEHGGM